MESEIDRFYRRTWPQLWPRFAAWTALAYVVNLLHARIRPHILRRLPTEWVKEFYVRVTTTVVITFTIVGLGALVACYYFVLRDRKIHTALSETGFAVRSILAALVAMAGFVLALYINFGDF